MVSPYLSFGKQVISIIVGTGCPLTLRFVLTTTGRIPALSHSLIPAITSVRDSGATSFSTETTDSCGVGAAHPTSATHSIAIGFIAICPYQIHGSSLG
jgi:hypothetical protein